MESRTNQTDRLSTLPDSILCHILSFLRTKPSAATSILAKRWRYLWTDVTNLRFDCEDYHRTSGHQMRFTDIVHRVLLLHNVRHLNTFRFVYKKDLYNVRESDGLDLNQDQLDTWIHVVVARNVQVLDLCLNTFFLELPRRVFKCATLVDLRLEGCSGIPRTVCLPNLKKLRLHAIQFGDDEPFSCLISGCPVLEELSVRRFVYRSTMCSNISSSTIKWMSLRFDLCSRLKTCDHKLEINTPALEYLLLEDHVSEHISAGTMNSLVVADIWLRYDKVKDDNVYSASVLEFVKKLCQVKSLRFSSECHKFTGSSFAAATLRFDNLTKLQCGADWRLLMRILECADNLEILHVDEEELKCWMEPQEVPECLSSHLSQVTITTFGHSEDEFKMLNYILKNGKVLNMMSIRHSNDFESKLKALRRISLMERASDICKVDFS